MVQSAAEMVGERLRQLRKAKKWTLKETAEASGLSVSFISDIERGEAAPTLTSLERLARALGVGLEALFALPAHAAQVTRADELPTVEAWRGDVIYYRLSSTAIENRKLECLVVKLLPSPRWLRAQPYSHEGEEFGYVLKGTLTMVFHDSEVELRPGDSIHLPSTLPHIWQNRTQEEVVAIWVITPAIH
ncbi:MAG: XRE family transcriptional regulator [Bacillota bacterium]